MSEWKTLAEHVHANHSRLTVPRNLRSLQRSHASDHHHHFCTHYHAGDNRGPDSRPVGWKTGLDAILRK